jgi:hypothetical protein
MKKAKPKNRITKSEALEFRKRWKIANALEEEELRALSANEKLEQLAMLMALAKELDWTEPMEREASKVRSRWNKLRKVYHA